MKGDTANYFKPLIVPREKAENTKDGPIPYRASLSLMVPAVWTNFRVICPVDAGKVKFVWHSHYAPNQLFSVTPKALWT